VVCADDERRGVRAVDKRGGVCAIDEERGGLCCLHWAAATREEEGVCAAR